MTRKEKQKYNFIGFTFWSLFMLMIILVALRKKQPSNTVDYDEIQRGKNIAQAQGEK